MQWSIYSIQLFKYELKKKNAIILRMGEKLKQKNKKKNRILKRERISCGWKKGRDLDFYKVLWRENWNLERVLGRLIHDKKEVDRVA